jgi:hypothetical protein
MIKVKKKHPTNEKVNIKYTYEITDFIQTQAISQILLKSVPIPT